jgi:hypothetical protein
VSETGTNRTQAICRAIAAKAAMPQVSRGIADRPGEVGEEELGVMV